MIQGELRKKWIEKYKNDPRAQACTAVVDGDMALLDAVLLTNGKAATAPIPGPIDQHPTSALIQAASAGDSASVERLLKAGADPNDKAGTYSYTPLGWSVAAQNLTSVRLLVDHGAKPDENENLLDLAVESAQRMSQGHLLGFLLEKFRPSSEALVGAIERQNVEWVELMLEAGADPNELSIRAGGRPLLAALKVAGDERPASIGQQIVRALVKHGADLHEPIGVRTKNNPLPLEAAVEVGAYWAIEPLIELGADINSTIESINRRTDDFRTLDGSATARAAAALIKAWGKVVLKTSAAVDTAKPTTGEAEQ